MPKKKPSNVIPFKRKPKLSSTVRNILESQPALKADLEYSFKRLPEEVRIGATEIFVRQEFGLPPKD